MKTVRAKSMGSAERVFRALSDRTRLRILHLLLPGELCVCHLVDVLDLPQPKVSRHLAYLRSAGLVIARKEGLWNYYRLASAQSEFNKKLLECLESCFREMPELARDAEQLKKSIREWCCQ
jgi:ArsR family transcriptional regulator, arsenate/arsenite/antimonite-responsive transcriptional repressor